MFFIPERDLSKGCRMELIKEITKKAKKYFVDACPSHDWSHIERVYDLCIRIGKIEKADLRVLKLAALLHDIGRGKENSNPNQDHAKIGAKIAEELLRKYKINEKIIEGVIHCIISHRYRSRGNDRPKTKEAQILFDADKLDCIGAIGVARAYSWVGSKKISIYSDKDYLGTGYEKNHSPVTEFLFKLSKVKDILFTKTGKEIAKQRHKFMESFFKQLKQEIIRHNTE